MTGHDSLGEGRAEQAVTASPGVVSDAEGARDEEFSAFYRATVRRLAAFVVSLGASLPVAADVAQDAMSRAYQGWAGILDPGRWVHSVAARAFLRRVVESREDPVEEVPESALCPVVDAYEEWEVRHDVLPLLATLPPRQRQVLAWTLAGYTPVDIAQELRIAPEAVRSNLRKARLAAASYLAERG